MFHLLVTRHLVAIAEFVSGYNLARPPPPLQLDRRPPREADELDKVIDAFNAMCASLQRAYGDLRQANAKLGAGPAGPPAGGRGRAPERAAVSRLRRDRVRLVLGDRTGSRFTYVSDRLDAFGMDQRVADRQAPLRCRDRPRGRAAEMARARGDAGAARAVPEFRVRAAATSTGRLRHVSVNGRPVFAADGRFLGYRGTATDLTKQHEAEERLRQSQKMDAIGQLTGGVAHDFNNVLTVITGTIEILQEGLADKPQLAAIAQLIDDAATRGAAITSQLLTFARRQPLEPREIDVNGTGDRDRQAAQADARRARRDRDRCSHPTPGRALADPSQLSAAIVNLAVNARDAMRGGGKLTIETANVTLDEAAASADGEIKPGAVRDDRGRRHRSRHPGRHPRSRVRAVLHHQGRRPRHRARPQHGLRLRQADRRHRRDRERGGARHVGQALSAARRKAGRRAADGAGSVDRGAARAARRSWWSRTMRWCGAM